VRLPSAGVTQTIVSLITCFSRRWFDVLSLDGSSEFRALSEIIQLDHFLKTKRSVYENPDETSPRPCGHFHVIGGTSVGGLLAIFFGLLGMSCDEARDSYLQLGQLTHAKAPMSKQIAVRSSRSGRAKFIQALKTLIRK
jgi:hypothetical protein